MVFVVVSMLVILVLCGALAAIVAFPHRGHDVPGLPWVRTALERAADRMPVLDETAADPATSSVGTAIVDGEAPAARR